MRAFRNLIERQIKKAEADGQLTGLNGEGQPLPRRHSLEDPALEAGHRIMAEAGVVPREFELKEQLDAARAKYRTTQSAKQKRALMARIADLEMRYNMEREAYRKFLS